MLVRDLEAAAKFAHRVMERNQGKGMIIVLRLLPEGLRVEVDGVGNVPQDKIISWPVLEHAHEPYYHIQTAIDEMVATF